MLSQISKTEKDKYRVISLVCGLLKLVATENRQMVARGGDGGGMREIMHMKSLNTHTAGC